MYISFLLKLNGSCVRPCVCELDVCILSDRMSKSSIRFALFVQKKGIWSFLRHLTLIFYLSKVSKTIFPQVIFDVKFPALFKSAVKNRGSHLRKGSYLQAEINNQTNVDPTLDTNFRLLESDCRRTVEMITMYYVGTTPVSNVVSIVVTNIFSTLAVNISKILVINFYY